MSGKTQFLELFENSAWNFNLFLDAINDDGSSVKIIFETLFGTILGVRNVVANVSYFRVFMQIDFHNEE